MIEIVVLIIHVHVQHVNTITCEYVLGLQQLVVFGIQNIWLKMLCLEKYMYQILTTCTCTWLGPIYYNTCVHLHVLLIIKFHSVWIFFCYFGILIDIS